MSDCVRMFLLMEAQAWLAERATAFRSLYGDQITDEAGQPRAVPQGLA